jgi:HEPN domain-containing protein
MTNLDLALSYITKARKRLKVLDVLLDEQDYSDVIRESQEIVELATKAMVSGILLEHKDRFPGEIRKALGEVTKVSKRLRKERELSFYGDIDFIPTEEYTEEDARQFMKETAFVVETALKLF